MSESDPTAIDPDEPREEDLPDKPAVQDLPGEEGDVDGDPGEEDVPEEQMMDPEAAADDPSVDDAEADTQPG